MAGRVRGVDECMLLLGLATVGCADAILAMMLAWDASGLGGECRIEWSCTTVVNCTRDEKNTGKMADLYLYPGGARDGCH
jgi:hypothetical protein